MKRTRFSFVRLDRKHNVIVSTLNMIVLPWLLISSTHVNTFSSCLRFSAVTSAFSFLIVSVSLQLPLTHRRMTLRSNLSRGLSIRSSSNSKKQTRSSSRSTFSLLTFKRQLSLAQIDALKAVLALRVSDPALEDALSSLPSNLVRSRWTTRSADSCSLHSRLSSGPLVEFKDHLAYELHPRLAHLYAFPREHLSAETRTCLYDILARYLACFPYRSPKDADKNNRESTIGSPCLACTLSFFLQDTTAVKALAASAKSRRRRGAWPSILDWLEAEDKGEDWERRWITEGAGMRRDRRKAQLWRRCGGGQEEGETGGRRPTAHHIPPEQTFNPAANDEEEDRLGQWLREQGDRARRGSSFETVHERAHGHHDVHAGKHPANPFADLREDDDYYAEEEDEEYAPEGEHEEADQDDDDDDEDEAVTRTKAESHAIAYQILTGQHQHQHQRQRPRPAQAQAQAQAPPGFF